MGQSYIRIAKVDYKACDEVDMDYEHEPVINDELEEYELVKFPDGWYLVKEDEG